MPNIVSAEGAGKGTLMDILTGMMGQNKVYQTTTPSREVFGNFNGPMSDAFLVNLNEVSASEMKGSSGKLKALITDNQMTINEKGVKQVQITSWLWGGVAEPTTKWRASPPALYPGEREG